MQHVYMCYVNTVLYYKQLIGHSRKICSKVSIISLLIALLSCLNLIAVQMTSQELSSQAYGSDPEILLSAVLMYFS